MTSTMQGATSTGSTGGTAAATTGGKAINVNNGGNTISKSNTSTSPLP